MPDPHEHPPLRIVAILVIVLLGGLPVTSTGSASAATAQRGSSGPEAVGVWPLLGEPEVVAPFAPPSQPWGAGHRGVDLLGRASQPVHAALGGTVSFAGKVAGKAVVVVAHAETRTTYEPVIATVSVGEQVAAGARIGRLDAAGSHCLPRACLHWGWIRGETYLDPLSLVGARAVRLLPFLSVSGATRGWPALRRVGAPAGRPLAAGRW